MRNTKNRTTRSVTPASSRASPKAAHDGVAAPFEAYAVAADGSRRALDARSIVVDLGGAEVEIDLLHGRPVLARRLPIAARGEGVLVVGPGDASSICIAVEPRGGGRSRPS
jgi:hypothetical protein